MDDNKLWKQAKARVEFKSHLRKYLFVNALLWCIWMLVNIVKKNGDWSFPWPIYVSAAWGIGVIIHYFNAYRHPVDDPIKREYEKLKKSLDDKTKKP